MWLIWDSQMSHITFPNSKFQIGSVLAGTPEQVDGGEGPVDDHSKDEDHNQHNLSNITTVRMKF